MAPAWWWASTGPPRRTVPRNGVQSSPGPWARVEAVIAWQLPASYGPAVAQWEPEAEMATVLRDRHPRGLRRRPAAAGVHQRAGGRRGPRAPASRCRTGHAGEWAAAATVASRGCCSARSAPVLPNTRPARRSTAVVVSTDLSHYHDRATASRLDRRTADAIVRRDPAAIGEYDVCGRFALRGLFEFTRRRDLRVRQIDLRTSGDVAGGKSRVVGYGAFGSTRLDPPGRRVTPGAGTAPTE
jgi:Memo-like protein